LTKNKIIDVKDNSSKTSSTNTSAGIQWDSNGDCQLRAGLGSQGSPAQSPVEENLNRGKRKLVAKKQWLFGGGKLDETTEAIGREQAPAIGATT